MTTSPWPLLDLRVSTPRLELRPPDEATVFALIDLAVRGIHDPDFMPFEHPWSTRPSPQLERESFQYFSRCWADWAPEHWDLPFAVWVDGEVVGVQGIRGLEFRDRRTFDTGSWLGRAHQGQGIGKEIRAAVLHFGFAGLGAARAETGAFQDNGPSLAVTASMGYEPNGDGVKVRNGEPTRCIEFKLDRDSWQTHRRDDLVVEGLDACIELFGAELTSYGGLDGCRAGWVLAVLGPGAALDVSVVDDFAVALTAVTNGHLAALAVDMPIGLPDDGDRATDRDARRRLGARRSTIFPTPCRATLDATTYDEALAISRRVTGKGLSIQAFNLLARIREVDQLMGPELQDRVVECHPELAFARLAGAPLTRSKHTPEGMADRVALLEIALQGLGAEAGAAAQAVATTPRGARPDDVADAIAVALVARHVPEQRVERLGDGAHDRHGLRMEIVA